MIQKILITIFLCYSASVHAENFRTPRVYYNDHQIIALDSLFFPQLKIVNRSTLNLQIDVDREVLRITALYIPARQKKLFDKLSSEIKNLVVLIRSDRGFQNKFSEMFIQRLSGKSILIQKNDDHLTEAEFKETIFRSLVDVLDKRYAKQ